MRNGQVMKLNLCCAHGGYAYAAGVQAAVSSTCKDMILKKTGEEE